jgi:hypothetical protein
MLKGEGSTVVSSARSLRSRVVPEGTASADSTIVAQAFCEALAEAAPLEPEKVQLVARLARVGEAVIIGSAGEARMPVAEAMSANEKKDRMVSGVEGLF